MCAVHAWLCTFLCMHEWRPERILSSSIIVWLIPIRQDLLLNLMLAILARLAGQKLPRTHPSLPLNTGVTGMHKLCLVFFIWILGIWTQLLMHWAIPLAHCFKFLIFPNKYEGKKLEEEEVVETITKHAPLFFIWRRRVFSVDQL